MLYMSNNASKKLESKDQAIVPQASRHAPVNSKFQIVIVDWHACFQVEFLPKGCHDGRRCSETIEPDDGNADE